MKIKTRILISLAVTIVLVLIHRLLAPATQLAGEQVTVNQMNNTDSPAITAMAVGNGVGILDWLLLLVWVIGMLFIWKSIRNQKQDKKD